MPSSTRRSLISHPPTTPPSRILARPPPSRRCGARPQALSFSPPLAHVRAHARPPPGGLPPPLPLPSFDTVFSPALHPPCPSLPSCVTPTPLSSALSSGRWPAAPPLPFLRSLSSSPLSSRPLAPPHVRPRLDAPAPRSRSPTPLSNPMYRLAVSPLASPRRLLARLLARALLMPPCTSACPYSLACSRQTKVRGGRELLQAEINLSGAAARSSKTRDGCVAPLLCRPSRPRPPPPGPRPSSGRTSSGSRTRRRRRTCRAGSGGRWCQGRRRSRAGLGSQTSAGSSSGCRGTASGSSSDEKKRVGGERASTEVSGKRNDESARGSRCDRDAPESWLG